MTPYASIVTKALVEALPASDRAAFYSAAFAVLAQVRRVVEEEQRRELAGFALRTRSLTDGS